MAQSCGGTCLGHQHGHRWQPRLQPSIHRILVGNRSHRHQDRSPQLYQGYGPWYDPLQQPRPGHQHGPVWQQVIHISSILTALLPKTSLSSQYRNHSASFSLPMPHPALTHHNVAQLPGTQQRDGCFLLVQAKIHGTELWLSSSWVPGPSSTKQLLVDFCPPKSPSLVHLFLKDICHSSLYWPL